MTDIMAELLKYIIKNIDYYALFSILFILFSFAAVLAVFEVFGKREGDNRVAISFSVFLAFASITVGASVIFIETKASDMASFLQNTNSRFSVKNSSDVYSAIGELNTENFILLNEKAKKYKEEQIKIESEVKREAKREAELKEKEKIQNIKKEIEEKVKK